jgi:pimeloyl-ACP methyl ester carboxylesterase
MAHATIQARGVDFAYLQRGPDDGPLALVLHGFPDSPVGLEVILDALGGTGYHAVAPWLRGFAPTSLAPDGDYHVGSLAADANALHEALGGDGRAVIIGHDWGASAVYPAITSDPERWRRGAAMAVPPMAALLSAMGRYTQMRRSWYMFLFQTPLAEGAVAADDMNFVDRLWEEWSPGLSKDSSHHAIAAAKEALRRPENLAAALGYYRAAFSGAPADPAAARAQEVIFATPPVPVCYLHGEDDGCVGIADIGDPTMLLAPGSRFVPVPDAGHFLHLEQPRAVIEPLLEFLDA